MEHEHISDKNADVLALRQILSCIELSHHGAAATLEEVYEAARGCDRCWMQLVRHLTAWAAAGWDSVDFDYVLADEHDVADEVERSQGVAALVANELAAVLDGDES